MRPSKIPLLLIIALCRIFDLHGNDHESLPSKENKEETSTVPSAEFLIKRIERFAEKILPQDPSGEESPIAQAENVEVDKSEKTDQEVSTLQPTSPPSPMIEEPIDDSEYLSYGNDTEEEESEEEKTSYSTLSPPPRESSPIRKEPWGLFITGDFLWWSAHEEGLSFASTGFNSNPTIAIAQSSVPPGKVYNFSGKWGPGFRVGMGYAFQPKQWDLYLNWTRFYQSRSKGVSSDPNNVLSNGSPLYDEWGAAGVVSGSPFNSINASWHLHYNTLDLELGRGFKPHKSFSVRPFMGLRGVIILQRLQILSQENNDFVIPIDPIVFIRNKNDFRGLGLRAGVTADFNFCHDFSIFGNFAAAIISGKFELLNHQTTTQFGIPDPYLNMRENFWSIKPELEVSLGLRWSRDVCDGRCRFELHAAWEELWWPDQNQMRRYLTPSIIISNGDLVDMPLSITEKGDLGIHGMTFGARLDF